MSGIFKSIKKVFKKVGKVIKKIAPYLIIAAGVYFGGSYLMSTYGGATSAAAGSAATSFTKSAGVWKSFLGGLTNGTAAQSAAAFAEGSYQASLGLNALPLSGQVLAGTSSVNALNGVLSTKEAVTVGVDLAKGAFLQSGGDAQAASNIVQKAWSQSQAITRGDLSVNAAGSSAITTLDQTGAANARLAEDAASGQFEYNPQRDVLGSTEGFESYYKAANISDAPTYDSSTMVGDVTAGGDPGLIADAAQDYTSTGSEQAGGGMSSNKAYLKILEDGLAQTRESNDRMYKILENAAAAREKANKNQLMWSMAQTGLKAFGAYSSAKAEEEYRDRPRNWKRKEDEPMWDPWSGEKRKGIIV